MKPKIKNLFICLKDHAIAMNMKPISQDKALELIEYVLFGVDGKSAWIGYQKGLTSERELWNLFMAHAATQISHFNNVSETDYTNYIAKGLCDTYEKALLGRPATRHQIDPIDPWES